MGEANESRNRSREMLNLSLQIEKYPRDLLQRFTLTTDSSQLSKELTQSEEHAEEIELNLGLSLGGRFGVDKNAKKKLLRSSSVAGSLPIFRGIDLATTATANATSTTPVTYPTIIRTSSLPTETEEEWRKRKELQTLRRMEAKRRRSEKQRNSSSSANCSAKLEKTDGNLEDEKQNSAGNRALGPAFGMQSWASTARQELLGSDGVKGGSGGFLQGLLQPCSQGSLESQGASSSGISEFESKPLQGTSSGGEARSPVTAQALQDRSNQEAVGSSRTSINQNTCPTSRQETESLSKKLDRRNSRGSEIARNAYEDMPCVFTKGDGPTGRKVEGILYRYGKGEEVRIMCVCHGSFLSPAEFVKHAGGGDVDHPLRHIVVNPAGAPFS